jgi:hypothetical protein
MRPRLRDMLILPLGRMPGGRGQMLRVLSGLQRGWFGRLELPREFLEALAAGVRSPARLTLQPPRLPPLRQTEADRIGSALQPPSNASGKISSGGTTWTWSIR